MHKCESIVDETTMLNDLELYMKFPDDLGKLVHVPGRSQKTYTHIFQEIANDNFVAPTIRDADSPFFLNKRRDVILTR